MKNSDIDFLNFRVVAKYLFYLVFVIILGLLLKSVTALLLSFAIIFYSIKRDFYKSIILWFIWFFVSGFFLSQGWVTENVVKYISKPSFLLFCIFFVNLNAIKQKSNIKLGTIFFAFLLIMLLSSLINYQQPFSIITKVSFFLLYFIIVSRQQFPVKYNNILNLFISVGILQLIVSFLQVSELIPPPSMIMDDGNGQTFLWVAGLDDAACGTFGAVTGHLVSWYESLLGLFLFLMWIVLSKKKYLICSGLCFLQFATVDSKTIMAVAIVMMLYFLFVYVLKERIRLKIHLCKIYKIIFIVFVFGIVLFKAWSVYYTYFSERTGTDNRSNLETVYNNEIYSSVSLFIDHFGEWGKIQGFNYVLMDFVSEGSLNLLLGYGVDGYSYNGKMGFIEGKDSLVMQDNNILNSRSGMIQLFATTGVLGFIFFFYLLSVWFKVNFYSKPNSKVKVISNTLLNIYLPFTLLASFLYSVDFSTIPVITFGAIIGILKMYSNVVNA